jgi:hypothetical protein
MVCFVFLSTVVLLLWFCRRSLGLKNRCLPRRDSGYDWAHERAPKGETEWSTLERSEKLRGRAVVDNVNGEGDPTRISWL